MVQWWQLTLVLVTGAQALTDEQYSRFPRLFLLDDYERCLSRRGGVYCLGTFAVTPVDHNPVYQLMEEYSSDPHNFDRRRIHRGYCVSSRCPHLTSNTSQRFEECVDQFARKEGLRASLLKLDYCRQHGQPDVANFLQLDGWKLAFLAVFCGLLAMNLLGTVHDYVVQEDKKSKVLTAWSMRVNWHRLVANYESGGDPRLSALSPVQGVRVFLLALVLMSHAGYLQHRMYMFNPRYLENLWRHPLMALIKNGTTIVQIFFVISSFLFSYNLLLYSKTHRVGLSLLPKCILIRIARISPVSLLMVGYAATWWAHAGDGPLWSPVVHTETNYCRRKFWMHVLYINNLIDPEDACQLQTWFLGVDMQLYIGVAALTLLLARRSKALALTVLGLATATSIAANGVLAYRNGWQSILFITTPENIRIMYRGVDSYYSVYVAPWANLPACLVGVFLAFLHFHLQEENFDIGRIKRWFKWVFHLSCPVLTAWVLVGNYALGSRDPLFTAVYIAVERPFFAVFSAFYLFGMFNKLTGFPQNLFSWRGWQVLGRMSLAFFMVHWCVNVALVASKHHLITTSIYDIAVDSLSTAFLSILLAIPVTVMVEMPVHRFLAALLLPSPRESSSKISEISSKATVPEGTYSKEISKTKVAEETLSKEISQATVAEEMLLKERSLKETIAEETLPKEISSKETSSTETILEKNLLEEISQKNTSQKETTSMETLPKVNIDLSPNPMLPLATSLQETSSEISLEKISLKELKEETSPKETSIEISHKKISLETSLEKPLAETSPEIMSREASEKESLTRVTSPSDTSLQTRETRHLPEIIPAARYSH